MFHVAIFDLNGTIIEDEPLWRSAFNQVYHRHGGTGFIENNPGVGNHDNWRIVRQTHLDFMPLSEDDLSLETQDVYLDLFQDDKLGLRKGFIELMSYLTRNSVICALATSSSLQALESVTSLYQGILDSFSVITHGDEVTHRKPAPDIFLKALEKVNAVSELQYTTGDCVVFEDSNAGVHAAKSANMFVVHLPNGLEQSLITPSPDLVAKDFTDKRIYKLFEGGA